jgi:phospholipid N-methyltransferase
MFRVAGSELWAASIMPVLTFMKEAVGSFRELGTFLPTQPFLAQKIARSLPHRPGMSIAELGAGEGSITRAIVDELRGMDYEFLVIEPRETLLSANEKSIRVSRSGTGAQRRMSGLRGNGGARLAFLLDDAFALGRILDDRGIGWVDAIVSSLPLFYFSPIQRRELFALARDRLTPEGVFIQYRYTPQGLDELRPYFGWIHRSFVANVLPAWLFVCRNAPAR